MDWIGFIKDWGAHIMSAFSIVWGIYVYLHHDSKLKNQEERLNDMQIRQMQKTEAKEQQADIKCNIIHGNKGNSKLRFVNTGQTDAINVRVKILTPEEELGAVLHDKEWGPYEMINPQSYREEHLGLCMGHPDAIMVQIIWDDSYQKDRIVKLSVPL